MANPSYPSNDANSVQNWEKRLYKQVVYRSPLSSLIGTDENSIIQLQKKPQKEGGDNIRYNLLTKLTQDGQTEGETVEGNGETLSVYQDGLEINELFFTTKVSNPGRNIIDQRLPFKERNQVKMQLATHWAERHAKWFFNQVCGYTPVTNPKYTGFNAITAPSRVFRAEAGGDYTANAADEDLAMGDGFTLEMIDYAVESAILSDLPIRPINIKAGKSGSELEEPKMICYIHPSQERQLRTSAGSLWKTIELAALQGGDISKNKLYTGALGEYRNVVFRRATEITSGVNSSTGAAIPDVKRAVLLGAQAVGLAYGKGHGGDNSYKWNEELKDHKRWVETSAMSMSGMKKMRYNIDGSPVDSGVIVMPSFSPTASL